MILDLPRFYWIFSVAVSCCCHMLCLSVLPVALLGCLFSVLNSLCGYFRLLVFVPDGLRCPFRKARPETL